MSYFLFSCLFGGVSMFCLLAVLYVAYMVHTRLSYMELKLLANSLKLHSNLKEQVVGAVEFHLKGCTKQAKKIFIKKQNRL